MRERVYDPLAGFVGQGRRVGPTGENVDHVEGPRKISAGGAAIMGDEVNFEKVRLGGVVPFSRGPHRNLVFEKRP